MYNNVPVSQPNAAIFVSILETDPVSVTVLDDTVPDPDNTFSTNSVSSIWRNDCI